MLSSAGQLCLRLHAPQEANALTGSAGITECVCDNVVHGLAMHHEDIAAADCAEFSASVQKQNAERLHQAKAFLIAALECKEASIELDSYLNLSCHTLLTG